MKLTVKHFMACCSLGLMVMLTACGGGGSGGGTVDDDPISPQEGQSTYLFELQGRAPGGGGEIGIDVHWVLAEEEAEANVWINPTTSNGHPGFIGSIDPVSGQVTVSQGTSLDLYDLTEDSLFGIDTLLIQVHETIVIPYSASPTSGVIQIEEDAIDGLRVTITLAGSNGDVWIQYDEDSDGNIDAEEAFSWDQFDELGDTGSSRQRLARFGIDVIQFLLNQVKLVEYALEMLGEHEDDLNPGPYVEDANSFSAQGLTGPAGIADPGTFTATWHDGPNDDGDVGPGDDFELDCLEAWLDDTDSEDDLIFDGQVDFIGFTEVVEDGETIRIGFEPYLASPGGVYLDNFTEYYTDTENSAVSIDTTFTLNGAFSIVFTAQ